jgi:hypothetical protein
MAATILPNFSLAALVRIHPNPLLGKLHRVIDGRGPTFRTFPIRGANIADIPESTDVKCIHGNRDNERVEGVALAEFPTFEQTVEWFNGDAYVQALAGASNGT